MEAEPIERKESAAEFSPAESAALGAGQGTSMGWADELGGAAFGGIRKTAQDFTGPEGKTTVYGEQPASTITKIRNGRVVGTKTTPGHGPFVDEPQDKSFGQLYREERDKARGTNELAKKANPGEYTGGEIGGDVLAQTLAATATGGATLSPGGQALLGGANALGGSDADLSGGGKTLGEDVGNYGKAALQSGVGAGMSYGLTKGANLVGKGIQASPVGRYLSDKFKGAASDVAAKEFGKATQAARTARAALGGETSQGSRYVELLTQALTDPAATPQQKLVAKQILDAGGDELKRAIYESALERAPVQLGRIQSAKDALAPALDKLAPDAIEAAANEQMAHPIKSQVLPRLVHMSQKAIPPALGYWAGEKTGHPVAGTVLGGVTSAVMGNPSRTVANMMQSPVTRAAFWGLVKQAPGAVANGLGRAGALIVREYQRNPDNALALDSAFEKTDPEYAAAKQKLLGGGQ